MRARWRSSCGTGGRLTCSRPLPSLCSSSARCGLRPAAISASSHRSSAAFSGASSGSAGLSQLRLRSLPRRLKRVPPRATPSLLAIGSTLTLYRPQKSLRVRVVFQQPLDQSLGDPVAARLPRMGAGANEDAIRRRRIADPDDLEVASSCRLADRRDLHQRDGRGSIRAVGRDPTAGTARFARRAARARASRRGAGRDCPGRLVGRHRPPGAPVLRYRPPSSARRRPSRAARSRRCPGSGIPASALRPAAR